MKVGVKTSTTLEGVTRSDSERVQLGHACHAMFLKTSSSKEKMENWINYFEAIIWNPLSFR